MKSEFDWIRLWQKAQKLPRDVRVGIGDDCAVVDGAKPGFFGLLKCDACVEGVHFTPRTGLDLVGRKVMARNISDIAAMGGNPRFALVSAAIPKGISDSGRRKLYDGLTRTARRHGCEIIGGDTSSSKSGLFVSVFVYGEVEKELLMLRSGAKAGDYVFVTGKLGGSIRGKHLNFEPRLAEARWLAKNFKPTAAIDLSDGLGGDLRRIAEQSRVGFEIFADQIPRSPGASLKNALYDGEDYELLFTARPAVGSKLLRSWKSRFGVPLSFIGYARGKNFGIQLAGPGSKRAQISSSYDHFRGNA